MRVRPGFTNHALGHYRIPISPSPDRNYGPCIDRTDPGLQARYRLRLLLAMGAVALAAGWLSLRAAPPLTGRAMFGLWRLPDLALAALVLAAMPLALCTSLRAVLRLALAAGAGTF